MNAADGLRGVAAASEPLPTDVEEPSWLILGVPARTPVGRRERVEADGGVRMSGSEAMDPCGHATGPPDICSAVNQ